VNQIKYGIDIMSDGSFFFTNFIIDHFDLLFKVIIVIHVWVLNHFLLIGDDLIEALQNIIVLKSLEMFVSEAVSNT
jgi:hypothetical protein